MKTENKKKWLNKKKMYMLKMRLSKSLTIKSSYFFTGRPQSIQVPAK